MRISALFGMVNAAQDLDQRGFASAILAQNPVHLAAAQVKIQVVQRLDARKRFADVAHGQKRILFHRDLSSLPALGTPKAVGYLG